MWLYFNQIGQLQCQLEHGTPARVGQSGDFKFVAYFDGVDLNDYSIATLSIKAPSQFTYNYSFIGVKQSKIFNHIEGETEYQPFVDDQVYESYVFGIDLPVFNMPGLWTGSIALINANRVKINALFTFNVQDAVSNANSEVHIEVDDLQEYLNNLARLVAKNDKFYFRVIDEIKYNGVAPTTDQEIAEFNSMKEYLIPSGAQSQSVVYVKDDGAGVVSDEMGRFYKVALTYEDEHTGDDNYLCFNFQELELAFKVKQIDDLRVGTLKADNIGTETDKVDKIEATQIKVNGVDVGASLNQAEYMYNKKNVINDDNKGSVLYYTSIKAVYDFVSSIANTLEKLSNKLTSSETISGYSTSTTKYPNVKAVYDFVSEIKEGIEEIIDDLEESLFDPSTTTSVQKSIYATYDNTETGENKVSIANKYQIIRLITDFATASNDNYPSALLVKQALEDIREIAEGKSKNYVLSYAETAPTSSEYGFFYWKTVGGEILETYQDFVDYVGNYTLSNNIFNTQNNTIDVAGSLRYFIFKGDQDTIGGQTKSVKYVWKNLSGDLKNGSNIFVTESDVPDRWYSPYTFYKLETQKIDLDLLVKYTDIINNLTSVDTNKALSAAQGKVLKGLIDALDSAIQDQETTISGILTSLNAKYTKPNDGIPLSDLAADARAGMHTITTTENDDGSVDITWS